MPWSDLVEGGWMIVGMNHYRLKGERHLFCAMAKGGSCIVAEGTDEKAVFEELKHQAKPYARPSE